MALNIVFMTCNDEKNVVKKKPSTVKTITGVFRENVDLLNPSFRVEGNITDFVQCNYLYIEAWKRYYFITDFVSEHNNMFTVSCHVDVLMSFQKELLANTAIIRRQENEWNLYLNDGSFMTYQNPLVSTHEFPTGFSNYTFILAVAGS